jgi:hypothetical protein
VFLTTDGSRLHAASLHTAGQPLRKDCYRPGTFLTGDGGAAYAAAARPGAVEKSAFPGSGTFALAEKALELINRLATLHTQPHGKR